MCDGVDPRAPKTGRSVKESHVHSPLPVPPSPLSLFTHMEGIIVMTHSLTPVAGGASASNNDTQCAPAAAARAHVGLRQTCREKSETGHVHLLTQTDGFVSLRTICFVCATKLTL